MFGGVYAFASCVIQRLRNKEDIWTSGLAGCSTGLVMGISSGFQGALASAAMMGGFSVVIDLMGKSEAQALALPDHTTGRIKTSVKVGFHQPLLYYPKPECRNSARACRLSGSNHPETH